MTMKHQAIATSNASSTGMDNYGRRKCDSGFKKFVSGFGGQQDCILVTYNGTRSTLPKYREGSIVRKYWAKARWKTSWANSKLCISMSDVKTLFRSPTPFSFVNWNTLFFSWVVPLPISSSPQQDPTALASPVSWGLQGNPGFSFTASCSSLSRPPFRNTWPLIVLSGFP